MPFAFHYAARSDVGLVRGNNEDSGYAGPHLLAMADGMGGAAGGEIASSTIVGALVDLDGEALSGAEATDALLDRIIDANAELHDQAQSDSDLEGMGTTLIALLRARDKLVLAHIGDSRAFLAREGEVTQITKDHSFVQQLVDQGRITQEEAATHPHRSLVTRVLTGAPSDEPDVTVRVARRGDRYLIASDGLTDYVARDTIDEVMLDVRDPGACADKLVDLALRAGAPDNVTVVVGDIVDIGPGTTPSTHPEVVGAAAARSRHGATRTMPVTPAEKAAALTREATGAPAAYDDELHLAEEGGPASTRTRLLRIAGALLVAAIVVAGGGYAAYAWTQQQYYLGLSDDKVTIFQGVRSDFGPINLSEPLQVSGVHVDDLPDSYRGMLGDGISMESRTAAQQRLTEIELQATACRWYKALGQSCRIVGPDWAEPSPSPSPSTSPSAQPSGSMSSSIPGANPVTPTGDATVGGTP